MKLASAVEVQNGLKLAGGPGFDLIILMTLVRPEIVDYFDDGINNDEDVIND